MTCDKQETSPSKHHSGNKAWDTEYRAPRDRYHRNQEESTLSCVVRTPTAKQRRKSSTRFSSNVENQDELYSMAATSLERLWAFHLQNIRELQCQALGLNGAHHKIQVNPGGC